MTVFRSKNILFQLHNTCRATLERLHLESRKTLNLLSLVIAHPLNVEKRTALKLQRDQEKEAQSANERCKRNLFRWLGSVLEGSVFTAPPATPAYP